MSEEMRDRVRRAYEALNRRDYDATMDAIEPVDSELEWVPPPEMPDTRLVYRGREAIKKRWVYLGENPGEYEFDEFIEAGERTFISARFSGQGGRSGVPIEGRLYQVITTRDDMTTVTRIENFFDRDKALEAAGLRE